MKFKLEKIKNAFITIEIRTKRPEEFLNLMWKRNIKINKIERKDINLLSIEIELRDYKKVREICKGIKAKIKIVDRRGSGFVFLRIANRISILIGGAAFIIVMYYLSTFIWGIDIQTERNIPPYNIREDLSSLGIRPGINKKNINVYDIERKLIDKNNDIMWARVRIYGSHLKVKVAERQEPPDVTKKDNFTSIVAKKDGYIVRIYSKSGTAMVKPGDVVKKGQVLIKGEQGAEGSVYTVPAKGDVIAKTYTEKIVDVSLIKHIKSRTGRSICSYYIKIGNNKFYLKKSTNKFKKYDKIVEGNPLFGKETYYEVNDKVQHLDKDKTINKAVDDMYKKMCEGFDKNIKVLDRIVNTSVKGDLCTVRLLIVTEEDIGEGQ